jgi:hypothetical protein
VKVLVEVQGGNVIAVWSDGEVPIELEIADYDNEPFDSCEDILSTVYPHQVY